MIGSTVNRDLRPQLEKAGAAEKSKMAAAALPQIHAPCTEGQSIMKRRKKEEKEKKKGPLKLSIKHRCI